MSDIPPPVPPVSPPPGSMPPPSPPPPRAAAAPAAAIVLSPAEDVEKNKVFAVLAYIGILWLVPLLAAKDSPFARYHANQGIVLFISFFIAASICAAFLFIPFIGCLFIPIFLLLFAAHLVLIILGIINAAQGRRAPLPVIGGWVLLK